MTDLASTRLLTLLPQPWMARTLRRVIAQFALDPDGDHGIPHWCRVLEHGLELAQIEDADVTVVSLFALLHDSRRENELEDPRHGPRGAAFARQLHAAGLLPISDESLDLLAFACQHHSHQMTGGPRTALVCWDADRLDLGRVGIRPDPLRLATNSARSPQRIQQAWERSRECVQWRVAPYPECRTLRQEITTRF